MNNLKINRSMVNVLLKIIFHSLNKIFLISIIVLFFTTNTFSQPDSTSGTYFVDARLHGGFLIAHRPSLVPLQQNHLTGFDLSVGVFTSGNKYWHKNYNFPALGFKYVFLQTGNQPTLGNAHALLPFFDVTLTPQQKIKLGLQLGWGIGYISKHFNQYQNYKNTAIGSHFNSVPFFGLFFRKKVAANGFISTGLSLTHFSNGSVVTPNLGINLATINMCYRFCGGAKRLIVNNSENPFLNKWETSVAILFALKQNYPTLGDNFFVKELSFLSICHFKPVAIYGFGVDLPYDPSITQRLDNRGVETNNFTPFRPGITAAYGLNMGSLTMLIQQGVYVYSQIKDDGVLYQRIGLRYSIKKKYFATFNLKTHFAKADYFELGVGTSF